MAVGDLLFAFDPSKESPESVKKKRAIAQAILATNRAPQTIGEGLNALGDGIVANVMNRRASEAEGMGQQSAQKAIAALIAGSDFGGSGSSTPASGFAAEAPSIQPDYASQRVAQAHGDPVNLSGNKEAFVNALMPAAIEASQRTGVDPRIIVAQAAQETGWGKSAPGNNYFGIKSHGKGGGQTFTTHEVIDGKRVKINDSFRQFASPADSVAGYADFLLENPRYKPMMAAQGLDAQLQALGASGYATDPNYASSVGSIARGIPLPAMGSDSSSNPYSSVGVTDEQFAAMQNGTPQPPSPMPSDPVQAIAGVMNQQQPVQVAQAQPNQMSDADALQLLGARAEPNMQQAPQPMQAQASGPSMQQLLQASQNPWLSDAQRGIVNTLMQQQMQQNDPMRQMQMEKARLELEQMRNPEPKQTDDIREYEFARQQGYQGTFQDFMTDMKRAGATNVTTNVGQGSSEYNKALDKKFAEQYITMQDGAQSARNKIATLQGLGSALDQTGYTGMGAESILAMKQAGRMLGLDIGDDLGPEETARALGNQLALQMRSPSGGAGMPGAMSDKDREFLVASVPGLSKTPEGNRRLIDYMMRIEERNIQVAQLAQAYADENGQIDNGFYKQLSEWSAANPMFPEQGGNTPKVYSVPEGVDPSDWEYMTPEEKALWQ